MTLSLEEHVARAQEIALHYGIPCMEGALVDDMLAFAASIRESERAACEAIAREEVGALDHLGYPAHKRAWRIADAIAARKGKGEGK
jgi:hypothetical protein